MNEFRQLWQEGMTFEQFVSRSAPEHRALWDGIYRLARVPEWALGALPLGEERRLLVIAEDWCGDASNTVPVLARWAEATPGLALRIVRRDEHPGLMDRYLTNGARSIPIVITLDRDLLALGSWGPRPHELQSWVMAHKDTMPKDERYREVRRWYARDKGATTIREVLGTMQLRAAA